MQFNFLQFIYRFNFPSLFSNLIFILLVVI